MSHQRTPSAGAALAATSCVAAGRSRSSMRRPCRPARLILI